MDVVIDHGILYPFFGSEVGKVAYMRNLEIALYMDEDITFLLIIIIFMVVHFFDDLDHLIGQLNEENIKINQQFLWLLSNVMLFFS